MNKLEEIQLQMSAVIAASLLKGGVKANELVDAQYKHRSDVYTCSLEEAVAAAAHSLTVEITGFIVESYEDTRELDNL